MMPGVEHIALPFTLTFFLASASCLAAALVLWTGLSVACRAWPLLAANRSVWLLSQLAVGAVFVLALLPQRAGLSVVPGIEIARPAPLQTALQPPLAALDDGADAADGDDAYSPWIARAAQAWLALYCGGLLFAASRWVRAERTMAGLLAASRELGAAELAAHPGFAGPAPRGVRVLETSAAISPMLTGLLNVRLLLPAHLRAFDPGQQRLIVAHELTHWRRRDPLMLYASLLLQTAFWFNPVLRMLGKKLHWAQELGCDRAVLAGRPQQQRQHYAAALVAQLKMQQADLGGMPCALAFGGASAASGAAVSTTSTATVAARVRLIREDGLRSLGLAGKCALGVAFAALLAASALLQPALAWHGAGAMGPGGPGGSGSPGVLGAANGAPRPADASLAGPAAAGAAPSWSEPLEQVRVTSFFGAPRGTGAPHKGIDFAARKGTAVLAVGDGVVVESADVPAFGEIYGKAVMIEHADGKRSFYAHLDRRGVRLGDRVKAGQQIGLAGDTGKVTGPHLHLEAFDGGQRIDPQQLLASLDARATGRALRLRPLR